MGAPPNAAYKDTAPYPQQPPYGYASSSMPPPDQHVPTNPDTDPFVKGFEFNTDSIRRGFIRKVYSILSVRTHMQQHLSMESEFPDFKSEFSILGDAVVYTCFRFTLR